MPIRRLLTISGPRSVFGDFAIVAFLVAQALDGIFSYVGLVQYGSHIEANPLISSVIPVLGQGGALATAKIVAATFGIVLHMRGVHRAVAALTLLYLAAAIVPWAALLLG